MSRAPSRSRSCLGLPDILGASVARSTRERSKRWSERGGGRADEHDRNSRGGTWIGNEDGERTKTRERQCESKINKEGKRCSQVQVSSFWWNMSEMRAIGWFRLNLVYIPFQLLFFLFSSNYPPPSSNKYTFPFVSFFFHFFFSRSTFLPIAPAMSSVWYTCLSGTTGYHVYHRFRNFTIEHAGIVQNVHWTLSRNCYRLNPGKVYVSR